ncbi:MAG: amino acid ABC transporter permease [Clostridia bacterium]|nr:amino acid ABC transporter permease [Clostridia bacterium]
METTAEGEHVGYGWDFIRGAEITLLVSVVGTVAGFIIGLLVAIVKTIPVGAEDNLFKKIVLKIVNGILNIYIEVFRGTPMMVQAMVVFYGLMQAFQIDLDALTAGLLIVSINTGAYMAEIVRGGIEAIDKGQTEGAQAIGMSHWQTMTSVILPQAIRNILPATGNEFVINIKDTSVLNVIAVSELYFATKSVKGATYRTFEAFFIVGVIYFVLTFTVTRILHIIEWLMDGADHYDLHAEDEPVSGEEATA